MSFPSIRDDTLSHEGILEDQGRDPEKFFAKFGIKPEQVLNDARAIAKSGIAHDFVKDGPHVVIGPIAIEGAQPGDVLKVDMVSLLPRVPYGVISNRHGKGALAGEFPENVGPQAGASADSQGRFRRGQPEVKCACGMHFSSWRSLSIRIVHLTREAQDN